ncbi:hypothetical protein CLCR_00115 [Cladophialophora carrionii]|uniref:Uncharacterized protein n=1 Tax=Cladophialophora carrionii TaxID=86049 RepID=A0A1C1C682_9EURO|nr:hypothetical protein CLCR_00115 [Cladophialophora carrionii]
MLQAQIALRRDGRERAREHLETIAKEEAHPQSWFGKDWGKSANSELADVDMSNSNAELRHVQKIKPIPGLKFMKLAELPKPETADSSVTRSGSASVPELQPTSVSEQRLHSYLGKTLYEAALSLVDGADYPFAKFDEALSHFERHITDQQWCSLLRCVRRNLEMLLMGLRQPLGSGPGGGAEKFNCATALIAHLDAQHQKLSTQEELSELATERSIYLSKVEGLMDEHVQVLCAAEPEAAPNFVLSVGATLQPWADLEFMDGDLEQLTTVRVFQGWLEEFAVKMASVCNTRLLRQAISSSATRMKSYQRLPALKYWRTNLLIVMINSRSSSLV